MSKVGDEIRVVPLVFEGPSTANTGYSSVYYSLPMDAALGRDYAVIMSVGTLSSAVFAGGISGQVVVGSTQGVSSFAALTGATFNLHSSLSTAGFTGLTKARLYVTGTFSSVALATASTIVNIDGFAFKVCSAAGVGATDSSTSCKVSSSNSTALLRSLSTQIPANLAYLVATMVSSAATIGHLDISVAPGEIGKRTFTAQCSAIGPHAASADAVGLGPVKRTIMLEFKSEDIAGLSTNTTNTRFAVQITATAATASAPQAILDGYVLCKGERYHSNPSVVRSQVSTVSSAFTS